MKLKFRAEPKDILIFVIFCVVLLYFVAIAVLNISSFANTGLLYGLNPFPAFESEYIGATLLFFVGALAAIFTSVSSYFFDREKGLGIKAEAKKEKGYSRWATEKEMKKELKLVEPSSKSTSAAGLPIIMSPKGVWVDDSEYHNLIIGSTGAGKTQTTVLPMVHLLSKKGESMIVTDPKGEIYEETAEMLRAKGYNIVLLNFRDPQQGNAWNPLSLPYSLYKNGNSDKATELLEDLALNILYDENSKSQDPFWEKTSADYFSGLALALFDDATDDQINLNSINLMTTLGEEKFGATTYVKEYFSYKDPAGAAYINASSTLMAPNETKGSILAVFKQKIKLFSSRENLSEMLSHSDFDMREIGKNKTAVFIVIQDEKKTYHSLVTIFLKQCYETLISVAQESGGKLPYRTNFILDEFANMPPLKDVTTMVTAARSRNMRFNFIIQNFAQLYEVYGKENGETIKGNCGNIVYLISTELSALEEISKMCGEVKSKEKEKTSSTPLVTVSDLQRLKKWETIVLRIRMMPFKTRLTPNFQMDWGDHYPKAAYPQREKIPVKVFDIKGYVEKKKEEKINQMLGGVPSKPAVNPFGIPPKTSPAFPGVMPPAGGNGTTPTKGGLDVDDLVKRIDAKIAELEEEERREKEAQAKKAAGEIPSVKPAIPEIPLDVKMPIPNIPQEINQPVMSEPTIPVENKKEEMAMPSIPQGINQPVMPELTIPVENKKEETAMPSIPQEINQPVMPEPTISVENKKEEMGIPSIPQEINQPVMPEPTIPVENKKEEMGIPSIPQEINQPVMSEPTVVVDKKEKVESTNDNVKMPSGFVTDDQFFDDFFNDEDE